ncbi:lipocalin family protein [Vibrio sp. 404]|uniref:Outer membrane lipoprotein Blc n=1 Tax=Vibrio marinisediminis TaxID=2758441 RepID=A0A7W2IVA9_9VIBR|nr:lipocalin family protein [Vibrio marinisediminis]MBA5764395.1 lipocalin family protein [Vibrio marinisediminis]
MRLVFTLFGALMLNGCLGMPETVKPVDDFEISQYLGKWYEVARLDHSFEEGLERVSAEYIELEKSGIAVINRGYDPLSQEWQQANGEAYFVTHNDIGYLQVSFFGPFYSSYVVFGLDKQNYQYAFVSGPTLDYLWLLSRTPTVSDEVMGEFLNQAKERGFNTDELIFVKH